MILSVSNPVASDLKDSCAKAVCSNDGNISSTEIIDFTSEQVGSNTQFLLSIRENIHFNINPSLTYGVDTEMADLSPRQVEKHALLLPYDMDNAEMTGDITYRRKRKYVHHYVYDDVQSITCDFVPDDINGTTVYIVPLQASAKMKNCKGTRLQGYGQTSKSKSFTKGPRLLYNCRGSCCCANVKCANITDFGIN